MGRNGGERTEPIDLASVRRGEGVLKRLERQDAEVAALLVLVAGHRHVTVEQVMQRSRCRAEIAAVRQIAMYLAHTKLSRTLTDVGILFERDRTTVSHACALVEDWRDRAEIEAEITELEDALDQLAAPATSEELRDVAC